MNSLFDFIISLIGNIGEGIIILGFILALLIVPALLNGGWIFYLFYILFGIFIVYAIYKDGGDNKDGK